jgi:hypothetical protein
MIGSPLSFVTAVPLKTAAFFLDILSFRFASLPDCQPEPVFRKPFALSASVRFSHPAAALPSAATSGNATLLTRISLFTLFLTIYFL